MLKKIIFFFLAIIFLTSSAFAQSADISANKKTTAANKMLKEYASYILEQTLLNSFEVTGNGTEDNKIVGVGVIGDIVIVTSGGNVDNGTAAWDNSFYKYTMQGEFIDSIPQNSTSDWGYRDLTTDGQYFYGSESNYIVRFDVDSLKHIDSIYNASMNPHRGLAYLPGENAIFSTNWGSPFNKINASTGETIREYTSIGHSTYGIALDTITEPGNLYIWGFDNPFMFRVDTSAAQTNLIINFIGVNIAAKGGIEIIDNYPECPGTPVAVILSQAEPKDYVGFININIHGAAAPDQFEAVVVGKDSIKLEWVDPLYSAIGDTLEIDSIVIYRDGKKIASVEAGIEEYFDKGLERGLYGYKVVAYSDGKMGFYFSETKFVHIGYIIYEDFEETVSDSLPLNWQYYGSGKDSALWKTGYLRNHTVNGFKCAFLAGNADTLYDCLITPAFFTEEGDSLELTFWKMQDIQSTGWLNLYVYLMNKPDSSFHVVDTLLAFDSAASNYEFESVVRQFKTAAADSYYIALYTIQYGENYLFIDDFTLFKIEESVGIRCNGTNESLNFTLEQNYPNPFNPSTSIQYYLTNETKVSLKIYDLLGREIKTLINEVKPSGAYKAVWDGTNDFGSKVSTGVYIYRLTAGEFSVAKKMMLIK